MSDQGWRALTKANNCNSTLWVVRDISGSISYNFSVHSLVSFYLKWKWHDIRPSTQNLCSAFNHPSAHTPWTHTPWTHTRSSGQPFMLQHPGSSWGFSVLLKGTSVVVLRVLVIHSPHLQFLPARDSNSQPLVYESDSLTIRPQLPHSNFNKIL